MSETQTPYPHERLRLKTYSHLQGSRIPSEYEVVTAKLLYYPQRGFEVNTPMREWYDRYQRQSALQCPSWDDFKDPRETTYSSYNARQVEKEVFVSKIFESIDQSKTEVLAHEWVQQLETILPVLRFPYHGLEMVSAYVGSMAPSGRIVITSAFQAADEVRKIQTLAYRQCQLRQSHPTFGDSARQQWQSDPHWQPLRNLIEKLLVTYDWGEAFVALNLCVKPQLDELFFVNFGRWASLQGDYHLFEIFRSLFEDSLWHREWSLHLLEHLFETRPENQAVVTDWLREWRPLAAKALGSVIENSALLWSAVEVREGGRQFYEGFLEGAGCETRS